MNQGRLAEAEALLRRALKADPSSFGLRDRLADVLLFTGQRSEALAQRRQALECNPYTPQAYRALADTCDVLHRYGEAAQAMEEYLALWPEDPYALHVLAYCHERAGQHRRALDAWRRLLRVVPGHISAERGIARLSTRASSGGGRSEESRAGPPSAPASPSSTRNVSDADRWM